MLHRVEVRLYDHSVLSELADFSVTRNGFFQEDSFGNHSGTLGWSFSLVIEALPVPIPAMGLAGL